MTLQKSNLSPHSNVALVCADGIGDALIASIAAHNLRKEGHTVTVFSPSLQSFGRYLEEGKYLPMAKDWGSALRSFDAVLLQHDETLRAKEIVRLRDSGLPLYIIYTNYRLSKHGPLMEGFDYPVDEQKPMVENMVMAMQKLFSIQATSQNSLRPLCDLSHRKNRKRVLIHPTSTKEEKNWTKRRFLKLAKKLKILDFEPIFILSPHERPSWPQSIDAPFFANLEDLATMVYESGFLIGNDSGPAHIASYFAIPHIVICQGRQMPLWSTGWFLPKLILPPKWAPNLKGMRFREEKWKYLISTARVLQEFIDLSKMV